MKLSKQSSKDIAVRHLPTRIFGQDAYLQNILGVLVIIRYNSFLRRSGGTADAAVSKTVVERRAGSNPASGTSWIWNLSHWGRFFVYRTPSDSASSTTKYARTIAGAKGNVAIASIYVLFFSWYHLRSSLLLRSENLTLEEPRTPSRISHLRKPQPTWQISSANATTPQNYPGQFCRSYLLLLHTSP